MVKYNFCQAHTMATMQYAGVTLQKFTLRIFQSAWSLPLPFWVTALHNAPMILLKPNNVVVHLQLLFLGNGLIFKPFKLLHEKSQKFSNLS